MTIIRGKRVVFEGGWMRLSGFAVKSLIRYLKRSHATDISTNNWRVGAWSSDTGWPENVTIFEQRVAYAGIL